MPLHCVAEYLFRSGCLLGAIQFVAGKLGKSEMAKKAVVHTSVSLGDAEGLEGFGIAVDIKVEGVDDELLQAGHAVSPCFFGVQPLDFAHTFARRYSSARTAVR